MAGNLFDHPRFHGPQRVMLNVKAVGKPDSVALFTVDISRGTQGVVVTLDSDAMRIAAKVAEIQIDNAKRNHRRCIAGFGTVQGHPRAVLGDLAVIALTGARDWWIVPPGLGEPSFSWAALGKIVRVRTTGTSDFIVRPNDSDNDIFVACKAAPDNPAVQVLGWIKAGNAKARGTPKTYGHADRQSCWAFPHSLLNPLSNLPGGGLEWITASWNAA